MTESVVETARTGKGMIPVLTYAAQFIVMLDIAIVNVALPWIQDEFGTGPGTLQWVVIAYGLMLGAFLLLGGRSGRSPGSSPSSPHGVGVLLVGL